MTLQYIGSIVSGHLRKTNTLPPVIPILDCPVAKGVCPMDEKAAPEKMKSE